MSNFEPISPQQSRASRPRAVTSMSYASTHSHRSSRSKEERKLDLTESARDKDKRRLEGKSDPTKALHEAQPIDLAQAESNLDDIRRLQHKDTEGNVIVDPDRNNPTRPRMERPLDTIRGFNAAAEGTTSRRSSYQRQSSHSIDNQNKRNSYYGNSNSMYSPNGRLGPGPGPRPINGGYYNSTNNRQFSNGFRPPQEYVEDGSYHQGGPRQQHQRYQAAPYNMHQGESPNSIHSHQQSYETMTSGSDEMSKSTNPSSQNSSFDQLHQTSMGMRKPENVGYENNGSPHRQMGGPIRNAYPPSAMPNRPSNYRQKVETDDYGMEIRDGAPAPLPTHKFTSNAGELPADFGMPEQTKRKSWLKRTFSKKA